MRHNLGMEADKKEIKKDKKNMLQFSLSQEMKLLSVSELKKSSVSEYYSATLEVTDSQGERTKCSLPAFKEVGEELILKLKDSKNGYTFKPKFELRIYSGLATVTEGKTFFKKDRYLWISGIAS